MKDSSGLACLGGNFAKARVDGFTTYPAVLGFTFQLVRSDTGAPVDAVSEFFLTFYDIDAGRPRAGPVSRQSQGDTEVTHTF